ncbi:MAG: hypothetical protein GY797_21460 [Deltaproteobacteria bacterium]|nr:hypothetical protein [Deltaproteobacteria bacterium]
MNETSGESNIRFIIGIIVAIMAAGGGIGAFRHMFTSSSIDTVEIKPQIFSLNVGDEKFLSVNQKDTKGNPSTFPIKWSSVIFDRVVYIFLKGCRHEYAQKNPFNAA